MHQMGDRQAGEAQPACAPARVDDPVGRRLSGATTGLRNSVTSATAGSPPSSWAGGVVDGDARVDLSGWTCGPPVPSLTSPIRTGPAGTVSGSS